MLKNDSSHETHKESNYVNRQLELNKLSYTIVNISAPFDCGYDAVKIIIHEDDIS